MHDCSASDGDASELPDGFFADLEVWFAGREGALADPLPPTPPLVADESPAPLSRPRRGDGRSLIKPKNSTQRQKEELQYLRVKAAELEARLCSLKRSREPNKEDGVALDGGDSAWKDVAKRQRTQRGKAEEENAQLLEMLRSQIRLARRMERLLGKREVWDQLQEGQWRTSDLEGQGDDELFDRLDRNVDARVPQLGALFESHGLDRITEDFNETKLTHTCADGIVLECKYAKLIPLDAHTVGEVVWRSFRQGRVKLANDRVVVIKESPDVVFSKVMVHEPPMTIKPSTLYQVLKRFPGVNCSYALWEFTAISEEGTFASIPPFQITVRGSGRLQPTALSNGAAGAIFHEVSTTTLTVLNPRAASMATEAPQEAGAHREISILTRLFSSLHQQKKASMVQVIENLLLDASLAAGCV